MKYGYILFPLCGAIICFAIASILKIRNKRSLKEGNQHHDIFDKILFCMKSHIRKYGGSLSLQSYISVALFGYVGCVLLMIIMGQTIELSAAAGLIGFIIPELLLRGMSSRQTRLFEDRYAQALRQMAASLRAGMTIQQSVVDLCDNPFIHDSVKDAFRQIDADLKVGINIRAAFMRAAQSMESEDARDVALALSLQNELGGNEAKVVETVARNISNRIMLRREIKSLFADTNITILTMDVVPLLIIAGLLASSPQYIEVFFQTPVMTILFIGIIIFTVAGSVVIRKVVRRGTGGK